MRELKPTCRAGHELTLQNIRLETIAANGRRYTVRRCKRCQCISVGNWFKKKRQERKAATAI